jgi:hypothetical protein
MPPGCIIDKPDDLAAVVDPGATAARSTGDNGGEAVARIHEALGWPAERCLESSHDLAAVVDPGG